MDLARIDKMIKGTMAIVAISTSLLFLYTAFFGAFEAVIHRSLLLFGAILWAYLNYAYQSNSIIGKILHVLGGIIAVFPLIYIIFSWDSIVMRYGIPLPREYFIGGILVVTLMYIGKRLLGWGFTIIVGIFLAYALLGSYMPGLFQHRGISLDRLVSTTFLTTQGIFGIVMNVASTVIIQFVVFAAFLRIWGAGDFFMDLSSSLFGSVKGGPAKIAVIGSGLTGMFNGVATANVASTGSVTIPLMKKNGYPSEFAGGVEAAASTGGQILPPIMGASAFIMAETLGVPISEIIKAATVPALLFFLSIYLAVHFKAGKLDLKGLKKEDLPNFGRTIKTGWLYFVPIIVLVAVIFNQFSAGRAAVMATITLIVLGFFIKGTKPSWSKLIEALKTGAEDTVMITIACAMAGIIIGVLNITGLAVSLGGFLVTMSSGIFILLLIFTMIASIILGMGLPTIAGYIIVSLTIAPVMISDYSVIPIAAHLFVFYFAILSVITPPVAVASFVAAGIANANPVKTGWVAFSIALPCFIVPFMFIYNPELLLIGSILIIPFKISLGALSIYTLAMAIQGYHRKQLNYLIRVTLLFISVLLIVPNIYLDIIGILFLGVIFFIENKQISIVKVHSDKKVSI